MSLYDYGLPVTTHEYRDKTPSYAVMAGVQFQHALQCHGRCGERKPQAGGTKRNGKFICADCKKPAKLPNWFGAMVTGTIAIPAVPKRHVRPHRVNDEVGTHGRDYEALVMAALNAGYNHSEDIYKQSGVNRQYTREILEKLKEEGVVIRYTKGHTVLWKLV